jgi:hypothetical protein
MVMKCINLMMQRYTTPKLVGYTFRKKCGTFRKDPNLKFQDPNLKKA